MSIRPELEKLWRSNKDIRTGDLEPLFIATVAPRKPHNGAILLTDVKLQSTGEYMTDHVWLSPSWEAEPIYELKNKATRKVYWGRQIAFTAQVRPYNWYSKEFGLVYTERGYWYVIEPS